MDTERFVRETWSALSGGDVAVMERVLAPDARWRAVEDGPWNCESRSQIVEVMGDNLGRGLSGRIEEVLDARPGRAIVAFRPNGSQPGDWPLEDGVRWLVLSFGDDGLITEMKGCATRRDAVAYAG
jgi:ketosteroid isomerase-like protein